MRIAPIKFKIHDKMMNHQEFTLVGIKPQQSQKKDISKNMIFISKNLMNIVISYNFYCFIENNKKPIIFIKNKKLGKFKCKIYILIYAQWTIIRM